MLNLLPGSFWKFTNAIPIIINHAGSPGIIHAPFVVFCCGLILDDLPISFGVTSLALEQSYKERKSKPNKIEQNHVHILCDILYQSGYHFVINVSSYFYRGIHYIDKIFSCRDCFIFIIGIPIQLSAVVMRSNIVTQAEYQSNAGSTKA